MNDLKALIIFLSQYDLTNSKMRQIIDSLGDKPSIKTFKKTNLVKNKVLTDVAYNKMLAGADETMVKTFVTNQANRGINITTIDDEDFPEKLKDIDDAPLILYYMGDLNLASSPSLSVVGTRKPTSYGKVVTEKLTRDVASAGIVIVSGLAYGIDSISHRKCLEVGGKTIAVLGGGFDHIYPVEHQSLAMEIAEKGLLLSEYRPKRSATKYTFPIRNRIIAALGDGVLITEATVKSGTIHTKDFALDYGKNIYAVPGNIDSLNSELTNEIIKRGQGECVTKSQDILKDYEVKEAEPKQKFREEDFSDDEIKIIKFLSDGMKSIDELTQICDFSSKTIGTCLTTLEIRGIISRMSGGFIALR